jgi:hypothetical protein
MALSDIFKRVRETIQKYPTPASFIASRPVGGGETVGSRIQSLPPISTQIQKASNVYTKPIRDIFGPVVPSVARLSPLGQMQQAATRQLTPKRQLQDIFNVGRAGATVASAPLFTTTKGLLGAGANIALGGGISKATGGSFTEGARRTAELLPTIAGVSQLSNPILSKGLQRFGSGITSRAAASVANVGQGLTIDQATGQPTTPQSLALDAVLGFAGGKTQFGPIGKGLTRSGPRTLHPEDLYELDRANDALKGKLDPIQRKRAEDIVFNLSDRYLPKTIIDKVKGDPRKLIRELQKVGAKSQEYTGEAYPIPGMGIYGGPQATGYKQAQGKFSGLADKKPRFEIDDSKAKINEKNWTDIGRFFGFNKNASNVESTLTELIDHPDLFKQYPELKSAKVIITKGGESASYDPLRNTITLPKGFDMSLSPSTAKSTLLHEIQHAIQEKEGFARGGSPSSTLFTPEITAELKKLQEKIQLAMKSGKDPLPLMDEFARKHEMSRFDVYQRLAGEVEARDVQSRMNLSPEERMRTLPYASQNIPVKDQIVKFEGGVSQSRFKASDVQTGKPITLDFSKNTEKAPNLGSRYGQDIEPAGKYIIQDEGYLGTLPKHRYGEVSFKKPLVVEHVTTGHGGWKTELSSKYGGKTGKALTEAIKKSGYDGIITVDSKSNDILEIVNISGLEKPRSSSVMSSIEEPTGIKGKTIGELQQARQNPDLSAYENAINTRDVKAIGELAAKYPSDARFQVHKTLGIDLTTPKGKSQLPIQMEKTPIPTVDPSTTRGTLRTQPQKLPLETSRTEVPQKNIQQTGKSSQTLSEIIPEDPNKIINDAKGEIGDGSDRKTSFVKSLKDSYTHWANRFQPVEDVVNRIEKESKINIRPEFNPYYQYKRLLGAGGAAEIRHKRQLQPIVDGLRKDAIDYGDFDVYLKSKRDLEVGSREGGTIGSDVGKARERIAALSTKYDGKKLEAYAQQLYAYQDRGLQMLRDAGFIDKKTYQIIRDANKNYVPFQRVMDELDNYIGLPTNKTQQSTSPIKKLKGSERQIYSPLESIIGNTYKVEAAISKNRVSQSIAKLGEVDPNLGFKKVSKSDSGTISVWENGKKTYYDVGKDIADVVKGLNEEELSPVLKVLTLPAQILRQGATGRNIDFMIPNMFKDQFDAAISSKYGYRPFVDWFNGLGEVLRYKTGKSSIVDEWMASGGAQSFELLGGRKSIQGMINESTQKKSLPKKLFSWVFEGIGLVGEFSEIPTRVGLYKRALKNTGNKLLAMEESREGTLDFARMGSKMKVANSLIPFLNVQVQGFDKMIRSARRDPAKFMFTMSALGATPQIAVTAYNIMNYPEEYGEIEPFVKQDNFVIVTGRDEEGRPAYISLPKGNVLPYITNPIDNLLSYVAGVDRQSFGSMVTELLGEMLPVVEGGKDLKQAASRTVGGVIPQAFKPAAEAVSNYNFYFGNEIVPWYMKEKPANEQVYESTPELYKYLGNVLNISPLQIKNTLEGYGASYAKTPAQIIEILTKTSEGEKVLPDEIPVLRRFFSTGPTPEQTEKRREREDEEREKMSENKPAPFLERLLPVSKSQAAEETAIALPENIEQLETLYKKYSNVVEDYENKKTEIQYGDYKESEKKKQLKELDKDYQYAQNIVNRISTDKSDKLFEIEMKSYDKGSKATTEERGEWAYQSLKKKLSAGVKGKDLQNIVNTLWDQGVLTSGKNGVYQYIKDTYGVDLKYTGGEGKKSSGGSSYNRKISALQKEGVRELSKILATRRQPIPRSSNIRTLETILRSRSPKNTGLTRIQDLLDQEARRVSKLSPSR